jgi:hypothetical protein
VFADERKKVANRWDYLCVVIVPYVSAQSFFDDLMSARERTGYQFPLKFSEIDRKAAGEKARLSVEWADLLLRDARERRRRVYFSVLGIDRTRIDFSLFGDGAHETGKYANVYNRFFRATLKGCLNHFFPSVDIRIRGIFHDTEGNLQNHDYFDWHCVSSIASAESRVSFGCEKVVFVDSDHRKESNHPNASHLIQFTDILVGGTTYCIHVTNWSNIGQRQVAQTMLPLVEAACQSPYKADGVYDQFRRFSVAHFPEHHMTRFEETTLQGEFYRPSCGALRSRLDGQLSLDFR